MNIIDLKYFVKCAEMKNISKASVELGIAQPSLSLAIKRLEEQLEANLLLRSKKGVSLTTEGKLLYAKAQEITQLWEETQSDVLNLKYDMTGTLRFGCHPSVGLYSLKYFLPKLLKKHPRLNVYIDHGLSRDVLSKIVNSEIDIGLVINPINHPDIVKIKLFNDEVCLWKKDSTKKENDANTTLICDPDLIQSKEILKRLSKDKVSFGKVIYTTNLENITNLVAAGAGIGIIPSRVVKESQKQLQKISHTPIFKDELYICYRYENRNLSLIREVVEFIKKYMT